MRRSPVALGLVVLLLVALVGGGVWAGARFLGDDEPRRTARAPEPPTGAALDAALSEPVEDPVYPDVGDPGVDALHYGLELDWDREAEELDATARITFRATADAGRFRLDLGEALDVSSVVVDGEQAGHRHRGKDLVVDLPVREDRRYVAEIDYSGRPEPVEAPTTRSDFSGLGFTVTPRGEVWTMQEPFGAYSWYPVNDHPSDKALYDFTVSVQAPWVGVANGTPLAREVVDGRTVTTYRLEQPAASYLVTLGIGDYRHETDETASGVPLHHWVPRRSARALERVRRGRAALEWAEEKLGPYPFSTAGTLVVDSASGMETQTLVTLGDTEYTLSDEVLVHEMVHHWFGNQVTPTDWRDVWMNEGITMYLQAMYRAETTGQPLDSIMGEWAAQDQGYRDQAGPPGDYDPRQFGQSNVYYCSALMWHEIRGRVGDDAFWRALRSWPRAHDDANADRDDLEAHLERETGTELSDLYDAWLLSPTTPPRQR